MVWARRRPAVMAFHRRHRMALFTPCATGPIGKTRTFWKLASCRTCFKLDAVKGVSWLKSMKYTGL